MSLSPDSKERLGVVFEVVKTAFHWGFLPTVLYLGNFLLNFLSIQNITSHVYYDKKKKVFFNHN